MKITIHYPHGPDLLLNLDGEVLVLPADSTYDQSITISGVIEKGAIPLSIQKAEALANDLLSMCQEVRELRKQEDQITEALKRG